MGWPDEPCAHCPVAAAGKLPCPAQARKHRPYCDQADPAHPSHHPLRAARLLAEADSPPPPPLVAARDYALAAARHVLAGRPTVDAETYDRRRATCLACAYYDPDRDACLKCGCGTMLKALTGGLAEKIRWRDQACPIGKW